MKPTSTTAVHVQDVSDGSEKHASSDEGSGSLASDNAALAALGYKQEFKRSFNAIEVFGLGFSIIGLFPSIAYVRLLPSRTTALSYLECSSVLVFAIPYGGPVAMVWGVRTTYRSVGRSGTDFDSHPYIGS